MIRGIVLSLVSIFLLCGCASVAKLAVGSKGMEIPQIVAYLEPVFRENKILVLGKIVIQNPTESALDLDKIYLKIKDEQDIVLGSNVLEWDQPRVVSKEARESPVEIELHITALDKEYLAVYLETAFTYKKFDLRIPIESKIAVLGLDALRQIIARPLDVDIYTKLRSGFSGHSVIDYVLTIANPFSIDVMLEDGAIHVQTEDGADVVITLLSPTLFRGSRSNQIKGTIDIGNVFRKIIRAESARRRPLRFQFSGKLRVPHTSIAMPFNIESVQEVYFSWFRR